MEMKSTSVQIYSINRVILSFNRYYPCFHIIWQHDSLTPQNNEKKDVLTLWDFLTIFFGRIISGESPADNGYIIQNHIPSFTTLYSSWSYISYPRPINFAPLLLYWLHITESFVVWIPWIRLKLKSINYEVEIN